MVVEFFYDRVYGTVVLYVIGNRRGTFSGGHKRRITASSNYRHTWSYVRARPLSVICMRIKQAKSRVMCIDFYWKKL